MSRFDHYPTKPSSGACDKAYTILGNAHDTASSFLEIFEERRRNRNARGTPRDEEQDLLRAMLSFSGAGLDSMIKQLVVDALPSVLRFDQGASEMFKTFVGRRIIRSDEIDHEFLADIISDKNPRRRLITYLLDDLTSRSLQSAEEILRVGAFFNIPSNDLIQDPNNLKRIFRTRNEIVHEMDVDFDQPNRNRRPRRKNMMIEDTNSLFEVSSTFLARVDNILTPTGP